MEKPDDRSQKSELRRPSWLKARVTLGGDFAEVEQILHKWSLNTVCREAACPNISECYNQRTATFLILGDVCTRNCLFCAVKKGTPRPFDSQEPERVAQAVKELGLYHVVITSVTRDDLPDGGARCFAQTIDEIRKINPGIIVEVLIPDLKGSKKALAIIRDASPHIVGHNVETVPRLYPQVRSTANYRQSLTIIKTTKDSSLITTKSGLMVGLGEGKEEILTTMDDLRAVGCDILTIGQYLSPTKQCFPIKRYYHPQEFEEFTQEGKERGFKWIEAGPLVRSSFHANEQWKKAQSNPCGL
ncbi:MAG TPA: lipoyl synthase [Thermodesulfobacteriota bacterium]|nr:lipoyl synthase [Thermodesulfobacteriota bacterium]